MDRERGELAGMGFKWHYGEVEDSRTLFHFMRAEFYAGGEI
jgi:hypothetical protein